MPTGETTEDHRKWQQEEAQVVERDRANSDRRTGGLFRGCFQRNQNLPVIRDTIDGVNRCPTCTWELEDGFCNSCQRAYGSDGEAYSADDLDYSDGLSSGSEWGFEQDFDDSIGNNHIDYNDLMNINDDISLDGEGRSVHGDLDTSHGEFNIGRAAARGLLGHHRAPVSPTAAPNRRRYAPSLLSDVAATIDDAGFSSEDSEDDDELDSLNGFLVDDETEAGHSHPRSTYSSSVSSGSDDGYGDGYRSRRRESVGSTFGNGDQASEDNGDGGPLVNSDDSDGGSEEGGAVSNGRRRRRRNSSTAQATSNRQRPANSRLLNSERRNGNSEPSDGRSSPHRPDQNKPNVASLTQRPQDGPIEVPSDSDSPFPSQRFRKRRPVVIDSSSDPDRDSDSSEDPNGPRKWGGSSGSATVGRHSPVPSPVTTQSTRPERSQQPPILIQSSPTRSATPPLTTRPPHTSDGSPSNALVNNQHLRPRINPPLQGLGRAARRGASDLLSRTTRGSTTAQGVRNATSPGPVSRSTSGSEERRRQANNARRRRGKLERRIWDLEQNTPLGRSGFPNQGSASPYHAHRSSSDQPHQTEQYQPSTTTTGRGNNMLAYGTTPFASYMGV